MILTEHHLQILKHVHAYSSIKRFHGMLPRRDANMYEDVALSYLLEAGLIEESVIITACGSNPKGYRLAKGAIKDLGKLGIDFKNHDWEVLREHNWVALDELEEVHIDALLDIYHFSKIKKFNGIAPKDALDDYERRIFSFLYDMGYLFHIKLKSSKGDDKKGYVLSGKARRVLKQLKNAPAT